MRHYTDALFEEVNLDEQWCNYDYYDKPDQPKLWISDSAIRFKNFLKNLPNSGMKGVRLIVAPDKYVAANANDYDHESMRNLLEEWGEMIDDWGIEIPESKIEYYTVGVPKCTDFELGNFEVAEMKQLAAEFPDDKILNAEYDPASGYVGKLIADYGTFEVCAYAYNSKQFAQFTTSFTRGHFFEDTELYKVLKPLLKRLYIYGQE